jgi:hypothetical protein
MSWTHDAPDLPSTPFDLDFGSWAHEQSGYLHWPSPTLEYTHTPTFCLEELPPCPGISPSPGFRVDENSDPVADGMFGCVWIGGL